MGAFPKTSWNGAVFQKVSGQNDVFSFSFTGLHRYLAQVYNFMADCTDQAINTPCVILTGASSQIGVFVIPRLVRAGFSVFAVSRKGKPEHYPAFKQVIWLDVAAAVKACQHCDYLLSAGPLELAHKFLMAGGQFQKTIVFSSSSVETKQESGDPEEKRQIRDMLQLESKLQLAAQSKELELLILRPTLIYGCGMDANISRLANWIGRFGFIPVNGKAQGLRQPVHADDLAELALSAMLNKHELPTVLTLAGGETLTYSDMVSKIFAALKKPDRLVHLPQWLFILLIQTAGYLGMGGGLNAEMVKRQGRNLVFDDRQARELLNYSPRSFAPALKDFSLPDF